MTDYDLGDPVTLTLQVQVDGQLTSASTVELTLLQPAGALTGLPVTQTSPGQYASTFTPTAAGSYRYRWTTTGVGQGVETGGFTVFDDFVASGLLTLEQAKRHLGLQNTDRYDDELRDLVASTIDKIESLVGALGSQTVRETVTTGLLRRYPVLSVTSVTAPGGAPLPAPQPWQLSGAGWLSGVPAGSVVDYVVGQPIQPRHRRAALRWLSWSWRRDHGGSETYLPTGDDAGLGAGGVGIKGIHMELAAILSDGVAVIA